MLHFTYRIDGIGWATATVANDWTEETFSASYVTDALRDLVDAVQSLFVAESTKVVWDGEPGTTTLEFRRTGSRVTLEVSLDSEPTGFLGEDELLHFASELIEALDDLRAKWGLEGYQAQWGHPFPEQEYRKLQRHVKKAVTRTPSR